MEKQTTQRSNDIVILFTTDRHGVTQGDHNTLGYDEVAGVKASHPGALLLDVGDALQGSVLSNASQGRALVTLMNAAGYDAMAIGNHEFDYSYGHLIDQSRYAHFPMLAANAWRHNHRLTEGETFNRGQHVNNGAHITFERQGVTVGVFAVTTPDLYPMDYAGYPTNQSPITATDPIAEATHQMATLRAKGAEIIICLAHLGNDPTQPTELTSDGLAQALPDVPNVILDGHSHSEDAGRVVNGTLIVQSASYGRQLGCLRIDPHTHALECDLLTPEVVRAQYTPDYTVQQIFNYVTKQYIPEGDTTRLQLPVTLWGGTIGDLNVARKTETNLGAVITDSMAAMARQRFARLNRPVIALHNGGGIRNALYKGTITGEDILRVLPFNNRLYFRSITPKVLHQALENGVARILGRDAKTGMVKGTSGGFPQISGFTLRYDPTKEAGNRVCAVLLDGEYTPLDPRDDERLLIIAMDEAKAMGGDGYTMLADLEDLGNTAELEPTFREYLTTWCKKGRHWPTPRIVTLGAKPTQHYTAHLPVTQDGKPYSGDLSYRVDGNPKRRGKSVDGTLTINRLKDGPHTIAVEGATDVLVDSISGAGLLPKWTVPIELMH